MHGNRFLRSVARVPITKSFSPIVHGKGASGCARVEKECCFRKDDLRPYFADIEKKCDAYAEPNFNTMHTFSDRTGFESMSVVKGASAVQALLKIQQSHAKLESTLAQCGLSCTEDLVLEVLRRHHSNWKPALFFFHWASSQQGYAHSSFAYNSMLDILGKMKQFDLMRQLVEDIPPDKRQTIVNETTFAILLNRYAGGHKVEEALDLFYRRKEFDLELNKFAFHRLLISLCRYKHVDFAESLFMLKKIEFPPDIKSRNIILNGWCVLGNLHEAKRFWNDTITSECKPDLYTYGIFINALTKSGKLGSAVRLFSSMQRKGCPPDVTICNCIIDALCFDKKIPDALKIFEEMDEKGCERDVATYNSVIKHLCKNRRTEKAYELLNEMEQQGCRPNERTYSYFMKAMQEPQEVLHLFNRMGKTGCRVTGDTYNLILKLLMKLNYQEGILPIWEKMEKSGFGPDQRSYTVMVHGLFERGRMDEAFHYFKDMISKDMIPEPRTKIIVKAIETEMKCRGFITCPDTDTTKFPDIQKGRTKKKASAWIGCALDYYFYIFI